VFRYLEEARRVMKTGGVLKAQLNGLPETAQRYDTWSGVRISAGELAEFARAHDFQLLALEGAGTQYMWTTWRKMPDGWSAAAPHAGRSDHAARLRSLTNAVTGEAAVPARGRLAAIALWVEDLPADADLNSLEVRAGGRPCPLLCLGEPDHERVSQLNAALPEGMGTGLAEVELRWQGGRLCEPAWIRVIPPGPPVPRVCAAGDGVDLLSGTRIVSGIVKVTLEEMADPAQFHAAVGGREVGGMEFFRTDPSCDRYEVNFHLPAGLPPGPSELTMRLGRRAFPPVRLEVV